MTHGSFTFKGKSYLIVDKAVKETCTGCAFSGKMGQYCIDALQAVSVVMPTGERYNCGTSDRDVYYIKDTPEAHAKYVMLKMEHTT